MPHTPEAFYRVQMWRVWWQEVQLHFTVGVIEPWLEYFGMMIPSIVHKDVDCRHYRIVAFQFFQHLSGCLRVYLFGFDKGDLEGLKINCALDIQPLAT